MTVSTHPAIPSAVCAAPITILVQGGIASGKSTICGLLADLAGVPVVDCDKLAHEVLDSAPVRAQVAEAFGEAVIEGEQVARGALAEIVFNDEQALARLESLVHPGVAARVEQVVKQAHTPAGTPRKVVIIDAAVAAKIGLAAELTVFVEAGLETRRARAATRGWEEGELERREARQVALGSKAGRADYTVNNDGDLEEAKGHVKRFWTELVEPRR